MSIRQEVWIIFLSLSIASATLPGPTVARLTRGLRRHQRPASSESAASAASGGTPPLQAARARRSLPAGLVEQLGQMEFAAYMEKLIYDPMFLVCVRELSRRADFKLAIGVCLNVYARLMYHDADTATPLDQARH